MKYSPTLTEWFTALTSSVQNATFVKLALTKPTPQAADLKSIDIRLITVKRELKLSFTYHHKTRDIVKNYTPDESLPILAKLLGPTFVSAKIFTLESDILLTVNGKNTAIAYHGATSKEVPSLTHDRAKNRLLDETSKPYLHHLGLTDAQGNILKSSQDKFRQINKYIEILDGLVKQLPANQPLRIADMGSGKGYLTFALYDHLTTTMGRKAEVIGVEYRADMVNLCNDIAQKNGFTGLSFTQGTIDSFDCTGTNVVIALHACDTATDDALAKAIKAEASLIVVAPCCHKQVRKDMKPDTSHPMHFLLRYGTYAERTAEMLTDGLRSLILELSGYSTNLFEFIGADHTPKNVMIVATRNAQPHTTDHISKLHATFTAAKTHFGLKTHFLEKLLDLQQPA